ncbi:uncharacterized protein LOC112081555 [Eutrema salsugineum]|uniref:uncharacterized protein LOC112081555 n=1 Tax=Eutrema salsugineum TaxID=72664 RepID=UPI000CECF569|nr:uncharacterized protein LOC112081555 [Eutrema salsugineum]
MANQPEEAKEAEVSSRPQIPSPANQRVPTCWIDASWIDHGPVSGLGWSLVNAGEEELFGQQGCRRSLSVLHAEMDCLLWAMAALSQRHIRAVLFLTDCSDLVSMTDSPADWPSFTSELENLRILRENFS